MIKRLLFVFATLISITSFASTDTTRVLFIGNSFTYMNDVPGLTKGLADAAGFPFAFQMWAPGGISVGDVAQGTSAHMNNPVVFDMIRGTHWDYVSLQDNQGRFIYGGGRFPDTAVSKVIAGHKKIRDSVRFYSSCAQMLWFAGWGPQSGYPPYASTGFGLIDNIYQNYLYLQDSLGHTIVPIGKAWVRGTDSLPSSDLWGPDSVHESLGGAYLTAATIFCSIYRIDPTNINFTGGLDSSVARMYRKIAFKTVSDSFLSDAPIVNTPTITFTAGTLTTTISSAYTFYRWYRNGVLFDSGTSNIEHVTIVDGCYQVEVTTTRGCTYRSIETCASIPNSIEQVNNSTITLQPIPAHDQLMINLGTLNEATLSITDLSGRELIRKNLTGQSNNIDVSQMPGGIYLAKFIVNNGEFTRKIVIEK